MPRLIAFLSVFIIPAAAYAAGLKHAERWELGRDGAWIFNFLILFAGIYWIIHRFIIPALSQRSKDIAKNLEQAEKLRMETMKALADIEYKTRAFEKEAAAMREEAIVQGKKIKEQIVKEAQNFATRIVEKAHAEIERETLKAMDSLKKETAELAVKLASELIAENVGKDDHMRITEEYIDKVGKGS
ncbi:MAG: F0F1 ATP synthase subunit B [Nitrospinota bacterium]